ncbi:hypothetical protein [Pelotalea chapellei]|uniref:DUF4136 domain-containing protein n=1 Tax=Pelotalea chapellei TaxID=44671 RepID=A0ABS5U658_9BACT|nr:hypothetical protein [Pelotalea chapellei]MBT1071160.1 hypothetical protein [Pelotalea chapellei]
MVAVMLLALAVLAGCSGANTKISGSFNTQKDYEAVYVVPFDTTLVPPEIGEPVFNEFVDRLNDQRRKTRISKFVILKEELKEVEPAWLVKQTYISGDLWGYVESSGCCSTEMKMKSRLYLYEPGKNEPSVQVSIQENDFFEHDRVAVSAGKERMSKKLARSLADAIITKLSP